MLQNLLAFGAHCQQFCIGQCGTPKFLIFGSCHCNSCMQSINASVVGAKMKARSAPITAGLFAFDKQHMFTVKSPNNKGRNTVTMP